MHIHVYTVNEENVATLHRDASVLNGQSVLINGDNDNYTGDHGYASHTITKDNSHGITIKLSQPYIINCIRMLLWDRDNRSYSYLVQVSLDSENWVTVVDRANHLCRSWQELFFKEKVVRYVNVRVYPDLLFISSTSHVPHKHDISRSSDLCQCVND